MAETFVVMDTPVRAADNHAYAAHVCGRETDAGRWEGWIEFHPDGGGAPVRTPRETTQPKRSALEYWATGLTATYLEGALSGRCGRHPPAAHPVPRRAPPSTVPRRIPPMRRPAPRPLLAPCSTPSQLTLIRARKSCCRSSARWTRGTCERSRGPTASAPRSRFCAPPIGAAWPR